MLLYLRLDVSCENLLLYYYFRFNFSYLFNRITNNSFWWSDGYIFLYSFFHLLALIMEEKKYFNWINNWKKFFFVVTSIFFRCFFFAASWWPIKSLPLISFNYIITSLLFQLVTNFFPFYFLSPFSLGIVHMCYFVFFF